MFNKSLTVVLPVYNGETRLRKSVNEILELASELTNKFGVLIIDDGSSDSTYEVAEELAAHFPQVSVRRHRHRRGLGSAIDFAQRQVRTDAIILHDGVTPINAGEIRSLWRTWTGQSPDSAANDGASPVRGPMQELANVSAVHALMERAHGRLNGFQLLAPASYQDLYAATGDSAPRVQLRNDAPTAARQEAGVGAIPPLPRPKFLRAIANFALGE